MTKRRIYLVIPLVFMGITVCCQAQDATRWRGPNANGIYPGTGLLKKWPAGGPEILWSYEMLGKGHSSPVVSNNKLYATGMTGTEGYIYKFSLSGDLIYRVAYGSEYASSYPGPRGAPVIVGNRIYLISGHGRLYCLNEDDGSPVWMVDLMDEFGGSLITWGHNETPVVSGDRIYCTPGGRKHNVVALNRHTGEHVWSCAGSGELSAYCSPLFFRHGGREILTTHTQRNLLGIDAETGDLLWTQSQSNQYSVHANTPVYHDGELLLFSGYGKGATKLALNKDGSKVSVEWKNNELDSRMGGAVLVDGYLYGSGDYNREWICIDWNTGKTLATFMEIGKGNVIYADGMLYMYSDRGELALVKAGPTGFYVFGKTAVTKGSEQHWAHPVIHEGILFLRHGNALIAYRVK
jgi:outer membrane protein assembly factor BamB